jgi:hypothetical protein
MLKSIFICLLVISISSANTEIKFENFRIYKSLNHKSILNQNNEVLNLRDQNEINKINFKYDDFGIFLSTSIGTYQDSNGKLTLSEVNILESYYQRDLFDNHQIAFGNRIFNWGVANVFNPAAYLNTNLSPIEKKDTVSQYSGKYFINWNYYLNDFDISLVVSPKMKIKKDSIDYQYSDYLIKYSTIFNSSDLELITGLLKEKEIVFGVIQSSTLHNNLKFYSEQSITTNTSLMKHEVLLNDDLNKLYTEDPYVYENVGMTYQGVYGFEFTTLIDLIFVYEYYYNGKGFSSDEWDVLMNYSDSLKNMRNNAFIPEDAIKGSFQYLAYSLNNRRHYSSLSILYNFKDINSRFTQMLNIEDFSGVSIFNLNYNSNEYLSLNAGGQYFFGDKKSDYGSLFETYNLSTGIVLKW